MSFSCARIAASRLVSFMNQENLSPDAVQDAAITPAPAKTPLEKPSFLFQISASSMTDLLGNLRSAFDQLNKSIWKGPGRLKGRSNLPKAQVIQIKTRAAAGARHDALAGEYGVTTRTINNIVRGVTRKSVSDVETVC